MLAAMPNTNSLLIVLIFLGVLFVVRQIIVSKSGVIRQKLGTEPRLFKLLDAYKLGRNTQISLFEVEGERILILHGSQSGAAMIKLNTAPKLSDIRGAND